MLLDQSIKAYRRSNPECDETFTNNVHSFLLDHLRNIPAYLNSESEVMELIERLHDVFVLEGGKAFERALFWELGLPFPDHDESYDENEDGNLAISGEPTSNIPIEQDYLNPEEEAQFQALVEGIDLDGKH